MVEEPILDDNQWLVLAMLVLPVFPLWFAGFAGGPGGVLCGLLPALILNAFAIANYFHKYRETTWTYGMRYVGWILVGLNLVPWVWLAGAMVVQAGGGILGT